MTRIHLWWIAGGLLACQSPDPAILEPVWDDDQWAVVLFLNDAGQPLTTFPTLVPPGSARIQGEQTWEGDYRVLVHVYADSVGRAMQRRGLRVGVEGEPVRSVPRARYLSAVLSDGHEGALLLDPLAPEASPLPTLTFERPDPELNLCERMEVGLIMLEETDSVPLLAVGDEDHYYLRLRDDDELDRVVVLRGNGTIEPHMVPGLVGSPSHLSSNGYGRVYGISAEGLFEVDVATNSSTIAPVSGSDPYLEAGLAGEMYIWDRLCAEATCPVQRVDGARREVVFFAPGDTLRLSVLSDQRAFALTSAGVMASENGEWRPEYEVDADRSARFGADDLGQVVHTTNEGFVARYAGEWGCVPDLDTEEECHSGAGLELKQAKRVGPGRFAFLVDNQPRVVIVGPEGLCTHTFSGDALNDVDAAIGEGLMAIATRRIISISRTIIWTLRLPPD